jgi:hypothetical protein
LDYQAARAMTASLNRRGWDARVGTLGALVVWSGRVLARAETMLRASIAEGPDEETPHGYLAQVLKAKG